MIGKKINQLATELAPVSTDLTIIGDPISGVSKKITLAQLGAIFSGAVSFYTDLASFPATGDINVIYCAKDTQKLYLWSGSAYTEVFPSQALLDTYQLRSEKGNANGYASLDSQGKVPISQLPSSIMEYKGTWSAATNTPTLANGTGDTGDVYICNAAGSVNFGAGAIAFAVGDYVIYSGTIWQRSSGAVGTVTSVAATITGDAIGITGSPVTTSGTLALAFSGTTSQYIRGNGTLANFPTSLVTGTGTQNRLARWSSTPGELINSGIQDTGGSITNVLTTAGQYAWQFNGSTSTGLSYGALIVAGTNASDVSFKIMNASATSAYLYMWGDGRLQLNNIPNATTDTDTFLVSDSGVIKYRTGAELLSDIGGASASGYVPYTGATANLDLGTHTLSAYDLIIDHTSGSGVAASITKGGNGEALTVVKSSGSGNAASITGGVTLLSELHLTTDLADAYIASATNWNTAYSLRITSATSPLSITSNVISIAQASGSTDGYLSSTDWTTFNNKQNALTNPVTGTGTTNYLPKFTGASTIGNSIIAESGNSIGIGTATPSSFSGYTTVSINNATNGGIYNILVNGTETARLQAYAGIFNVAAKGTSTALTFETNGSERVRIDTSGNLGLGVTPSAWGTYRAFDIGLGGSMGSADSSGVIISSNSYNTNNSGWKYKTSSFAASIYEQYSGGHYWSTAPSGTAGNAISFTQAMTLNASGNLSIGNTNDTYKLDVTGTGRFSSGLNVNSTGTEMVNINVVDNSARQGIRLNNGINSSSGFVLFNSASSTGTTSGGLFIVDQSSTSLVQPTIVVNQSGTGDFLQFKTGATSKLTIASTGAATFSSSVECVKRAYVTGISTNAAYTTYTSTGSNTAYFGIDNSAGNEFISGGSAYAVNIIGVSAYPMIFGTNNTERMRITSSGLVGIATTSPDRALTVNGQIGLNNDFVSTKGGTTFRIGYDAYVGNSAVNLFTESAVTLAFGTNATERMRITSGGELLVGTTSTTALTTGSSVNQGISLSGGVIASQVNNNSNQYWSKASGYTSGDYTAHFVNGTYVGGISTNGSTTTYAIASDYRLKTDLKEFNGLDLLNKIKTYDYEWKSDGSRMYGVIAHELQSIINYAVTGVKDGDRMQGVDYSKIVPVLIKSIQELKQELDTLKNK